MIRVPLSGKRGAGLEIVVDNQDYDLVKQYRKWFLHNLGYAVSVARGKGGRKMVYLHRVVMRPPKGQVVDHINHDKLDNRRSNLRVCSQGQNQCNRQTSRHNKLGHKNIHPYAHDLSRFRVQVNINGKGKQIGVFDSLEDAISARDNALRRIHKEFANVT